MNGSGGGPGEIKLTPKDKTKETVTYSLTPGSLLFVTDGATVSEEQLLAEITSDKVQKSTEKATKDVTSDLAGEVLFSQLVPEEKTDRQGNTTRIAQRGDYYGFSLEKCITCHQGRTRGQ
jgi:DNA-directed RNA polymerase subunit beta'